MTRNAWLGLSLAAALGLGSAAIAQDKGYDSNQRGPSGDRQTQDSNRDNKGDNKGTDTRTGKDWDQNNKTGQAGITGKLDENQVKQVFQQKEYLKGLNITSRIEGDVVTLEGTVPSKAYVVAAVLAVYELPGVKFVNVKLAFNEGGEIGMHGSSGPSIGFPHDTPGAAGTGDTAKRDTSKGYEGTNSGDLAKGNGGANRNDPSKGTFGRDSTTLGAGLGQTNDLEVVVAIFPAAKTIEGQYGSITGQVGGATTMPAGMHDRLTDVIIFKKGQR